MSNPQIRIDKVLIEKIKALVKKGKITNEKHFINQAIIEKLKNEKL